MKITNFLVEEEDLKQLKLILNKKGQTMSKVLRNYIRQIITEDRRKNSKS